MDQLSKRVIEEIAITFGKQAAPLNIHIISDDVKEASGFANFYLAEHNVHIQATDYSHNKVATSFCSSPLRFVKWES